MRLGVLLPKQTVPHTKYLCEEIRTAPHRTFLKGKFRTAQHPTIKKINIRTRVAPLGSHKNTNVEKAFEPSKPRKCARCEYDAVWY